jgi:hypothetical protein
MRLAATVLDGQRRSTEGKAFLGELSLRMPSDKRGLIFFKEGRHKLSAFHFLSMSVPKLGRAPSITTARTALALRRLSVATSLADRRPQKGEQSLIEKAFESDFELDPNGPRPWSQSGSTLRSGEGRGKPKKSGRQTNAASEGKRYIVSLDL